MTGTKYTLKLNVPASQKKNIIWSSQYKNIAAINANGVITAKNKGTTKIRAIFKGKKYFCTVKVEDPKLNKTNITLKVNQEYQLKIGGGISSGKMVKSK